MASSIRVDTKFFAAMREIAGRSEDTIVVEEESSVNVFLNGLVEKFGVEMSSFLFDESGEFRSSLIVLVNGKPVDRTMFSDVLLRDRDLVVVLPPISGGYAS